MAAAAPAKAIGPGSTIGILGGGQLGRMTALAAARLGYRVHVFCQTDDEPAAQVASARTLAAFDDRAALARFAEAVQVITFEFENVPAAPLHALGASGAFGGAPLRPSAHILEMAQNRIAEKSFLNSIDVPTARWASVTDLETLEAAAEEIGAPALMKTAALGYDGKGQQRLHSGDNTLAAWKLLGQRPAILEAAVDFACEVSVIVARGPDGATACYPPTENRHERGILRASTVPARVTPEVGAAAMALALQIATRLQLVGLLAVEMFVGKDGTLLVNELAPRPHNSGHWTIDASATSQFEQLVRAICGLPLGSTERHFDAEMRNLLGPEAADWATYLAEPGARLHLYGKAEPRRGRKMGHVTWLTPKGGAG